MKKFVYLIILLFCLTDLQASHLLGADLTYECIGPNQYIVRLTIYRDCNGINLNGTQTVDYSSANCNTNTSIVLNQVGTQVDITPLCNSATSACSGTGTYGIEQFLYEDTVTLPVGCDDWVLSWDQCCRNNAINTLNNPSAQGTTITADLDNSLTTCNSSPVFNNPPSSMVCVNQPVVYNHGVSDIDGDSLVFSLGDCFDDPGVNVNYVNPYSGTNPLATLSGITINPNTGAISFTPTQLTVAVVCVRIEEYRNGVLIGTINRDMQFTVIQCSNQPPESSDVNGNFTNDTTLYEAIACTNSTICFNINAQDADGDNVFLSWNNEIPTATFTTLNNGTPLATGQFCWTPTVADVGLNVFTINVVDDACPVVGSGTYTYAINVIGGSGNVDAGPSDSICTGQNSVLQATTTPTALSYYWSPSATLSSDTTASVIATPTTTTQYLVTATFPSGCVSSDTVTVFVDSYQTITAGIDDSVVCVGDSVTLTSSGGTNWGWEGGVVENVPFLPAAGTSTFTVVDTLPDGCLSYDSISFTVHDRPNVIGFISANNICLGEQVSLAALGAVTYSVNNGVALNTPFTPPYGSTPYVITGYNAFGCSNTDTIVAIVESPFSVVANADTNNVCLGDSVTLYATGSANYSWNNGVIDSVPFVPPLGSTTYIVSADSNSCPSFDTIVINVGSPTTVTANISESQICEGDSVYVYGTGADTYNWNNGVIDSTYFIPSIADTVFILEGSISGGCPSYDTVNLSINQAPNVLANVFPNDTVCENDSVMLYGSNGFNFTWNNGVIDSTFFTPPPNATTTYILQGEDAIGCIGTDTISITSTAPPIVSAFASDTTICIGDSILLYGQGADSYIWQNGIQDSVYFFPQAGTNVYTVIGSVNSCTAQDSITIEVNTSTPITANASQTSLCIGDSILLYGQGSADSYLWSNGVPDSTYFTPTLSDTLFVVEGVFPTGCSSFDTIRIDVHNLPNVVANVTPSDSICIGDSVLLFGSGAQTYTWSNGTLLDSASIVPPVGNSTYTVRGEDMYGCINYDSLTIVSSAPPSINASASDTIVCAGESVTLTASGGVSYVWTGGVVNNVAQPSVGVNEYIVSGANTFGCSNTDTVQVLANALPATQANTDLNNVCTPATITLTGSGADDYVWSNSVQDGVSFNPPVGSTDYIVTGIDTTTNCSTNDTITIQINDLPTIIPIAVNNDTLCQGSVVTLSATGADTYNWSGGIQNGVPFLPSTGTTTYYVTGTDTNGCQQDTSITLFVYDSPIITISASPSDSLCDGEEVTLTASGAISYTWSNGSTGTSTQETIHEGTNTFSVVGAIGNNCVSSASIDIFGYQNYSINQTVSICEDETYTLPDGVVVNSPGTYTSNLQTTNTGCDSIYYTTVNVNNLGSFTPLDDTVLCQVFSHELILDAQNVTSFTWYSIDSTGLVQSLVGDTNYSNTTSDSLRFNLGSDLHNTSYYVEMIDQCNRFLSDTMHLEYFEAHAVENGVADTVFCLHEISPITVDYNGYNYTWNNGDTGPTVIPNESGGYIVTFTENYTGCTLKDTIEIYLEDCIARCVVMAPSGFSPNDDGNNDRFNILTTCEEGLDDFSMHIYNRWGELIYTSNDLTKGWDGTYKGRNADIGVYTFLIEYEKSITGEKGLLRGNVHLIR